MIKTNQEFASVLIRKASQESGQSVFESLDTLEIVPEWVESIAVAEPPLVLAGVGDLPDYCVTDSSVWRRGSRGEPQKLFCLESVAATYWMRRDLWQDSKEISLLRRMQWAAELKTQRVAQRPRGVGFGWLRCSGIRGLLAHEIP
jgi:hypothetical protein